MKCPECNREVSEAPGTMTYSCTVPGCLKIRFCCPHCILKHMGDHVRERNELIAGLFQSIVQADEDLNREQMDIVKLAIANSPRKRKD